MARAHLDPAKLTHARRHAALNAARGANRAGRPHAPRVAGRRSATLSPCGPATIDALSEQTLRLLQDHALRDRVTRLAAATLNGAEIARIVTPGARQMLIAALGAETRDHALSRRKLAAPPSAGPPLDAETLKAHIDRDAQTMAALLAQTLPAPLSAEFAPGVAPPHPDRLRRFHACLSDAIAGLVQ